MTKTQYTAVDEYLSPLFAPHDAALEAALAASASAGLPAIQVSPLQGKLLQLLARSVGARRILEIGTLGGYSTIWLARALAGEGHVLSLEVDPKHAAVACANLVHAGFERGARALRFRVHRCRQAGAARVLRLGCPALAAGYADRGGQRRARGRGDRCR